MDLARRSRPPLAALTCWILLALFAGGYQPARAIRCACTAAHNCGCSCWSPSGAHETPDDAGGGCCARARADDASCPSGPNDTTVPPGGADHHRTARLDWDRSEPRAIAVTPAPRSLAPVSRTVRPDWSPEPPEHPPRVRAAVPA